MKKVKDQPQLRRQTDEKLNFDGRIYTMDNRNVFFRISSLAPIESTASRLNRMFLFKTVYIRI